MPFKALIESIYFIRTFFKFLPGQSSDKDDVDDLMSQLRQAEEQVNDLKERLKTSASNVEQYRAMVTSLEDSLNKEKQVCITHIVFS